MSNTGVINQNTVMRRVDVRRSSAVDSQNCNAKFDCHKLQRPMTVSYELSEDIRAKEIEFIERRYGGRLASHRAAKLIQNKFREYQLRKDYDKLKIEKRASRKLDLPTINHSNQCLYRSPTSPQSPESVIEVAKPDLKKQNSYEDLVIEKAYFDWDREICNQSSAATSQTMKTATSHSVKEKKAAHLSNVDSGVDSVDTSSISLTPSPTGAITSSFSALQASGPKQQQNVDSNCTNPSSGSSTRPQKPLTSSQSSHACDLILVNNSSSACISSEKLPYPCYSVCSSGAPEPGFMGKMSQQPQQHNFTGSPIAEYLSNPRLAGCRFQNNCFCQSVRRQKRLYRICLNIFNKSSVKGVAYLIRHHFVEASPPLLAKFLMTRKGLSRSSIGDYLGQTKDELAMDTLKYFVRMVDMHNKEIDVALRHLLSFFQIPGESQKIKQIMEEFQESYIEQNADWRRWFCSPDTVMILAYAIIMLHTDMYNPNIRKQQKMSRDDFIRNLRGVDDGADVNCALLHSVYERIGAAEIKTFSDHTSQVRKIDQHLTGQLHPPSLVQSHRRLVCYCRLFEVVDINKKDRPGAHQRDVFLFNDLLLVTKTIQKRKKDGVVYQCRRVVSLTKVQVYLFESILYPCGLQLKNDSEVVAQFNTRTLSDRKRFIEDLMETIAEVREMERVRIDEELAKQQQQQCTGSMVQEGCYYGAGESSTMTGSGGRVSSSSTITSSTEPPIGSDQPPSCPCCCQCACSGHTAPLDGLNRHHHISSIHCPNPRQHHSQQQQQHPLCRSTTGFSALHHPDKESSNGGAHIRAAVATDTIDTGQPTRQGAPINPNVYNHQNRISGDSGLQEDFE